MEGDRQAMKFQVKEHDRGTFWVRSRQGKGEYMVDVTALNGNGACNCPHFRCRLQPKVLEDGETRRCKHILAVREYMSDMIVKELSRQNKDIGV